MNFWRHQVTGTWRTSFHPWSTVPLLASGRRDPTAPALVTMHWCRPWVATWVSPVNPKGNPWKWACRCKICTPGYMVWLESWLPCDMHPWPVKDNMLKLGCRLLLGSLMLVLGLWSPPTQSYSCWVCGLIIFEDFGYREGCLITLFDLLLSPPLCSAAYALGPGVAFSVHDFQPFKKATVTDIQYAEDENSSQGLDWWNMDDKSI